MALIGAYKSVSIISKDVDIERYNAEVNRLKTPIIGKVRLVKGFHNNPHFASN